MNLKEVLLTGLKIVGGILAGAAVFFGLGKLFGNNEDSEEDNSASTKEDSNSEDEKIPAKVEKEDKFQKVIEGARSFQDSLGKFCNLFQSITAVIENASRVFSKNSSTYQPIYDNGFYPGWAYGQPQPIVTHPNGFTTRRISPFITEVGPAPSNLAGNFCM